MQLHLFTPRSSIETINARMGTTYGPLFPRIRPDPVSQLIRSLIGSQTRDNDSERAFDHLRDHLYPWETLLTAPDGILLPCLRPVTYAERKAPQLRGAMRMIKGRVGALCRDFLDDWPVEDAQRWLRDLPGVDVKVSAAVLNFSTLRKRVLVVDCHYFRVAKRLGVLRANTPRTAAQRVLMNQHIPEEWTADDLGDHHSLMKLHGQAVCCHTRPNCRTCPLQDICPTGTGKAPRAGDSHGWSNDAHV